LPFVVSAAFACQAGPAPVATGGPRQGVGAEVVRTSELVLARDTGASLENPYQGRKEVLADGRRYYGWFNCAGCHGGAGGGGIGPPLVDRDWIYGGEPANIFLTIVQGRPNGMPSYGGQLTDDQVWKIVSFVTSLSTQDRRKVGEGGGGGDR
jgi:cytochrome c oxidase cbb3-type subunit 3